MNTLEALQEMESLKEFGDFKVINDPQEGPQIRYDFTKKDSIADKWKEIIDTFGEQDWRRIKFHGYCPTYCPAEIFESLTKKYKDMFEFFAEYGCD